MESKQSDARGKGGGRWSQGQRYRTSFALIKKSVASMPQRESANDHRLVLAPRGGLVPCTDLNPRNAG